MYMFENKNKRLIDLSIRLHSDQSEKNVVVITSILLFYEMDFSVMLSGSRWWSGLGIITFEKNDIF